MIHSILRIFRTRVWVSLSGLLLFVALARRMGPELQGVVSYSVMLANLLVLGANVGLDTSAVFFMNRKRVPARDYLRLSLPLLLCSATFTTLLLIVFSQTRALGGHLRDGSMLLPVVLLVLLDMALQMSRFLLLARERFDEFNRLEQLVSVFLLLFVGAALVWQPTRPAWVVVAYVACRVMVMGWVLIRVHPQRDDVPPAHMLPTRKGILAYSLQPWIGNVITTLGTRLDMFLLAWFITRSPKVTAVDLGLYTICLMAMTRIQDAQMAINNVFYPRVASVPLEESRRLAARFYRISWLVYVLIFLAVVVAGWPVLALFGKAYTSAFPTLLTLTFGYLVVKANVGVIALYFTSTGRPHVPIWINAATTLTSLILLLVLIPLSGTLGAALASLGAGVVSKILYARTFLVESGLKRQDLRLRKSDLVEIRKWVRNGLAGWMGDRS